MNAATPAPGAAADPIRNTTPRHWGLREHGVSLGISLGGASNAAEWQRLLAWVDRAEAWGLHSVWIPEMHFSPGATTSPLLALAACAARSRRLRLGTVSLLLPIRPPLRVAEEVAALDRLSGGRVLLGLGRGFRAPLFRAFGIDPTTKRDRFDAALDVMLARWAGRRVDRVATPFGSERDPGDDADPASARPLQQPFPPLAVAAFGRQGLLQASQRALPYLASPLEPLALIEENLALHREHLPSGIDPDALVVPVMRTVYVAATDSEAARVRAALAKEAEEAQRAQAQQPRGSVPASIARAAGAASDERAIVGLHSEVIDRLSRYRERLGMDLLVARPQVAATSDAEREASLERLAAEVVPALGSLVRRGRRTHPTPLTQPRRAPPG